MHSAKHGSYIKILAIIMALLLLFNGSWTGVNLNGASNGGSAKSYKVYLRAFVPGDFTPLTSIGHYDIMIKGAIKFRGKTFTNPVFSYRMEDSRLDVFSESATGRAYDHSRGDYYYDCDLYQWHIETISRATLTKFLSSLNSIIASSSRHPATSSGVKCRIKSSNAFSKYRATSTNCFTAVAAWLKGMGDNTLMNFYSGVRSGDYSDYFPHTLVRAYSSKFSKRS